MQQYNIPKNVFMTKYCLPDVVHVRDTQYPIMIHDITQTSPCNILRI